MWVVSCADVRPVYCCGLLPDVQRSHASQSVRGNLGQPLGEKGMGMGMMMMMMRNLGQQSGKPEGDLGSLRTLGHSCKPVAGET